MVIAGKVFRLAESLSLAELADKLGGYHVEEPFEEEEHKFRLITEVADLFVRENEVTGVFSCDYVTRIFHRGETVAFPRTVQSLFSFVGYDDKVFLTVVEKKLRANGVANALSRVVFGEVGGVLEGRISPEGLREFHLMNREDTKVTFFDNVDVPNVDKLSLYGPDLVNASLFEDYCKRGDLWYVVARCKKSGLVVGVTRDVSVVVFNLADKTEFLRFVHEEIFPLVS